jgi:hypothetical protein
MVQIIGMKKLQQTVPMGTPLETMQHLNLQMETTLLISCGLE